jgi:prepilin peptidase CpaA
MYLDVLMKIGLSGVLIAAGINDILSGRIRNYLTYPAILLAVLTHSLNSGLGGALFSLAGLMVGLAVLFPLYMMRMMGAGDVKLMGAVGAVLGSTGVLTAFLWTAITGGIYALIVLAFNKACCINTGNRFLLMGKTLLLTGQLAYIPPSEQEKQIKLRYGLAIALGTISYMLWEYMGYSSWSEFVSVLSNKVL